ncbi:hypothetical protein KY290_007711 [Solanum tuberosum]|uniref:Uncharacterized protein n=1 Tax=Solanum tuberosum TaxID=4113 RepID=A0ABQ7W6U1_SOLTU|nr:hypothetical protein KY290_007711 [Solanum tuberosum]
MSSISTQYMFVLYCLLKKYCINWVVWFKEYMLESIEDPNASTSLPKRLPISRILVDCLVDLSMFTHVVINVTNNSRTFSSMGYVKVENKWVKKDSVKAIPEAVKPTKISAESASLLMQDNSELKTRIVAVECGLTTLHDAVKKLIQQVDSLKSGVSFSNNDLVVSVQTSYSSLSRNVEHSYNSFCGKVINTLKYFLDDR